jgi:uncharacterized protein (UPF0548 family)
MSLMIGNLSYDVVGLTCPGEAVWSQRPAGYRCYTRTVRIGHGQHDWDAAVSAVMTWGVKTRSGFAVEPVSAGMRVQQDADYRLIAHLGPLTIREPVRVVAVVNELARCGFAYGTLDGHPVSGEEAFVVHRSDDGGVWLTLRSLTRASQGAWRWAFPLLLAAQQYYRRRYLRALKES